MPGSRLRGSRWAWPAPVGRRRPARPVAAASDGPGHGDGSVPGAVGAIGSSVRTVPAGDREARWQRDRRSDRRSTSPGGSVVVTGGTRGIGPGHRRGLPGRRGRGGGVRAAPSRPAATCRRPPTAAGRRARVFVAADVRDADQAAGRGRPRRRERLGRLDVLVNNAGGSPYAAGRRRLAPFFASVVTLNLLAPFYCAQAANAVMQAQADGRLDRQHRQRVGPPPLAGHRRLRGGQGRPDQPDPDPGGGVGAQGPGQLRQRRHDRHRGGRRPLRRARGAGRGGGHRAPRPDGHPGRRRRALPLPGLAPGRLRDGANLVAHGGGEWPPYMAATDRSGSTRACSPPGQVATTRKDLKLPGHPVDHWGVGTGVPSSDRRRAARPRPGCRRSIE